MHTPAYNINAYTCIHTCTYTYIHTRIYIHTREYIHIYKNMYTHTRIYTYIHGCIHTFMNTSAHTYIQTYLYMKTKTTWKYVTFPLSFSQKSPKILTFLLPRRQVTAPFIVLGVRWLTCRRVGGWDVCRWRTKRSPVFYIFFLICNLKMWLLYVLFLFGIS